MSVCVLNGSVECMNVIKNRKETENALQKIIS